MTPDAPTRTSPDSAPTRTAADPDATHSELGTASLAVVGAVEAFQRALTSAPAAEFDPPPGFVLEEQIGAGGMGVVYCARQLGLNRPVALKLVKGTAAIDAKALIRFLAEAEVVAAIRHPNVVEVYQYGEHGGKPYMALEYCPGGDLTSLVNREAKTSATKDASWFRRIADLMAKVADGVHAAHAQGVVHRDLKPHNVFLTADGTPKVADFGLAKRGIGSDLTNTEAVMGTPAYMAPEQAGGGTKFVGPEADVWALGVMLYELCCGERPIDTSGPVLDALARVANPSIPSVRSKLPTVPTDLSLILHKCLSLDPRDRYPNAGALANDLRCWLEGKPISARRASSAMRTWKWMVRNPVPAGLIVAVLVALLASVGFLRQSLVISQIEEANANQRLLEAAQRSEAELNALEEKKREQMKGLQETYLEKAKVDAQRGDARDALGAYDEAVAAGAVLTDAEKLDRAALLFRMYAPDRREHLLSIDPKAMAPDLRARWHLLNGYDLLGQNEEQATAELHQALTLLPPTSGEASFAKSLLEMDVGKALRLLEDSIDRNPTALDPRHMQLFILLTHGRFEEVIENGKMARSLAPNDPQTALFVFLSCVAQKQSAGAKKAAAILRKQCPAEVVDTLESLAPVFLAGSIGGTGLTGLLNSREFVTFLLMGGGPKLQKSLEILSGKSGVTGVDVMFLRRPRCIQSLTRLVGYLVKNAVGGIDPKNLLGGVKTQPNGGLLTDAQYDELKEYAVTSQEGFGRFLYASELALRNEYVGTSGFASRDRKTLAPEALALAEQYEAAWRAKGFLFDARAMSLDGAILYSAVAAVGLASTTDHDPALAKRTAGLLRERITDPRVKDRPLFAMGVTTYVRVALTAGDSTLALMLLERLQKEQPGDPSRALGWALFHHDQGNWEAARLWAMMTLEYNHEQTDALRIYRDSTDQLRRLAKAGY
jgi:tetratricopeptide (TPR) repeat protein